MSSIKTTPDIKFSTFEHAVGGVRVTSRSAQDMVHILPIALQQTFGPHSKAVAEVCHEPCHDVHSPRMAIVCMPHCTNRDVFHLLTVIMFKATGISKVSGVLFLFLLLKCPVIKCQVIGQ